MLFRASHLPEADNENHGNNTDDYSMPLIMIPIIIKPFQKFRHKRISFPLTLPHVRQIFHTLLLYHPKKLLSRYLPMIKATYEAPLQRHSPYNDSRDRSDDSRRMCNPRGMPRGTSSSRPRNRRFHHPLHAHAYNFPRSDDGVFPFPPSCNNQAHNFSTTNPDGKPSRRASSDALRGRSCSPRNAYRGDAPRSARYDHNHKQRRSYQVLRYIP